MIGTEAARAPAPIVLMKSRRETDAQSEQSDSFILRSLTSDMGAVLLVGGVIQPAPGE